MIRVGIGGWDYAPWRGSFFPLGLPKREELAWASRRLTAIEINATFYRTQSHASFVRWAAATPPGFRFALKGPRAVSQRGDLSDVSDAIARFIDSGVDALQDRLGPILWQFAPHKRFERGEIAAFLDRLPREIGGLAIRHAIEAPHASFRDPAYVALLRAAEVAPVLVDAPDLQPIADVAADFVYLRLKGSRPEEPLGYPQAELDAWAARIAAWARGAAPADLPPVADAPSASAPRAVYAFVIAGAKERAPHAAMALQARLGLTPSP